ncbi:MAG: hypothetical protein FWD13_07870 [Treponema sp.]|nr:hypothetical protein [Treponema sp.]
MADPGLLQALDYILNKSNEVSIDALAEAVARRRRDLTIFNAVGNIPDPQRMAKDITERVNTGISGGIESMRKSVQDMIIKLLKEHAPELNEKQVNELCQAWLPDRAGTNEGSSDNLPPDVCLAMIEQFVSFSHGEMKESVDKNLRDEMGAWPQRYWDSFPPVVRSIISDYLKNKISEKDYKSRIVLALGL